MLDGRKPKHGLGSKATPIVAALALTALLESFPARAVDPIVELDVSFEVVNKNDSPVQCQTDGQAHTIRGSLVAPASVLDAASRSATVYLHGSGNARLWHFTSVTGHDHITEMARLGHASFSIDQLGYGDSDIPDGSQVCLGGQADIAAQIGQQLRDGTYTSSDAYPRAFERIALAGISMGGHVTETTAYSFPGAYDAFMITGWGYMPPQTHAIRIAAATGRLGARCMASPEPKDAGEAGGYALILDRGELAGSALFYDAEPEVIQRVDDIWEREACGIVRSQGAGATQAQSRLESVTEPVLAVVGEQDIFAAPEFYASRFSASADHGSYVVPGAGHIVMLERQAPVFRAWLHDWLVARDF